MITDNCEIEQKQTFLRQEILEKGYCGQEFSDYAIQQKENGKIWLPIR
jgi:hypothetical protein